jgi:phosphoserine phosphatase
MTYRLLFLDMEGTLFASQRVSFEPDDGFHTSLWSRIFHELGPEAVEDDRQTLEKWERGEYRSYLDWCDESLRILQRRKLKRKRFEDLVAAASYNPGVPETIRTVHERGVRTAIVSGGFVAQARRAQAELRTHHACAAVDLFWTADGELAHWNIFPSDYEGKVDFVRLLMREYGFSPAECAFVGDGPNDMAIAREVGLSFAYRAHPELQRTASHRIEDFGAILKWL